MFDITSKILYAVGMENNQDTAAQMENQAAFDRVLATIAAARQGVQNQLDVDKARSKESLNDSFATQRRTGTSARVRAARKLRMTIRKAKQGQPKSPAVFSGSTVYATYTPARIVNHKRVQSTLDYKGTMYNKFTDGSYRRTTVKAKRA